MNCGRIQKLRTSQVNNYCILEVLRAAYSAQIVEIVLDNNIIGILTIYAYMLQLITFHRSKSSASVVSASLSDGSQSYPVSYFPAWLCWIHSFILWQTRYAQLFYGYHEYLL